MSTRNAALRTLLAGCVVLQTLAPSVAPADPIFGRLGRLVHEATYHGHEPPTCEVGAIEELAENIDWLEHHIDRYGSIVAKQPDIWGEARLTKHRDEYERVLFRKLGGFEYRLNASIAQSDSSFLAQALALSAAASPSVPQLPPLVNADPFTVPATSTVFGKLEVAGADKIALEPTIELDQLSRYVQHLHELRRINEGDDTSDSPGYAMNLVRIPVSILPGKLTREGFGAEVTVTATPVLSDDLMPSTFRKLAVNDVVDLIGLPLVRTTEAMIDGKIKKDLALQTVINARPVIKDALLADVATDRHAVIAKEIHDVMQYQVARDKVIEALIATIERYKFSDGTNRTAFAAIQGKVATPDISKLESRKYQSMDNLNNYVDQRSKRDNAEPTQLDADTEEYIDHLRSIIRAFRIEDANAATNELIRLNEDFEDVPELFSVLIEVVQDLLRVTDHPEALIDQKVASPTGRMRRALNPLNPTALTDVIGFSNLVKIAGSFEMPYSGRYVRWNGGSKDCPTSCGEYRIGLMDARRFLQAETEAAYDLLSSVQHTRIFSEYVSPDKGLAVHIRGGDAHLTNVIAIRESFFQSLHLHAVMQSVETQGAICPIDYEVLMAPKPETSGDAAGPTISETVAPKASEATSCVEALAWAIVVEAALLNERLNQDVRKLAKAKEVYELNTQRDYHFFLPDTVTAPDSGLEDLQAEFEMATDVFQQYVRARWPIHVFAIDPREQDQNVADVSMRKRELQFALAVGFVTGQIGGNSLTQYSRDLQTQIETVSLNRTAVGFGHGNNTFGWRFQPRVQALEVPGTLGALRETLCGTSRDYDLKHRQLEPGMRECVAVVLMPSFVPYADFDVRTNWYKLTNPKNSALTMKDTVRLSRAVTAMRQTKAQCSQCQHLYRDGEVNRMMTRVEQLDRELPLQSMRALVPYENTLGGFEMFNTGVTDLSPELVGWYGAPGIVINPNGTNCYACGCTATGTNGALASLTKTCVTKDGKTITETVPLPICEGEGTSVFLVGDNFSVHDTKVIAGGVCIPHVQLVSREIMRVTIPSCVNTVTLCENGEDNCYVSVYLATPYGVTNHLHIPVYKRPNCTPVTVPPPPAPAPCSDCTGCGYEASRPESFVRPISAEASSGLRRLPITPASLGPELPSPALSDLEQVLGELDSLRSEVLERLQRLESVPTSAGAGVVNVDFVSVAEQEQDDHEGWCNQDHPLLQQMHTKTMECWRNLRDQLPCY